MDEKKQEVTIDEFATFCKRKGFVYPTAEIYGGLSGFYDYGHFGTLVKKKFENVWRKYFLALGESFFEIEASEIMPEPVFIASGHLKHFNDIAAKCTKGHIERADHLLEKNLKKRFEGINAEEMFSLIKKNKITCSVCKSTIEYVGPVSMMFPLELGTGKTKAYLRPETAQSPYVNFKIQYELMRNKLPFGLALIGRAYRNELSPRNLLLRQRAFTQAELQIFFNPDKIEEHEDFESVKDYSLRIVMNDSRDKVQSIKCRQLAKKIPSFYVYHLAKVQEFYLGVLKIKPEKFRFYELNESERAFYNRYHFDMELELPSVGWTEVGGVHYRTDHDLLGHEKISKENMSIKEEGTEKKFIPHVLELSFGVDRNVQSLLMFAYNYDKKRDNIVLNLQPIVAPVSASVFPLISKGGCLGLAKQIYRKLRQEFVVSFDVSGSIGKRYARNDEIGTPICITVDEEGIKDKSVTVRDRDTTKQARVKISELPEIIRSVLRGENVLKFGKLVETRVKEF